MPFQDVANHAAGDKLRKFELSRQSISRSDFHAKHTLVAALHASLVEPRTRIVLAHLTSIVCGVEELSDNAVE